MTKLLDAEKLKKKFRNEKIGPLALYEIDEVIDELVESESEETVDDVLDRFPKFATYSFRFDGLNWNVESPYGVGVGTTKFEAAKNLEELIFTNANSSNA